MAYFNKYILPLGLKGRFYATLAVLYIMVTFYARYFGAYLPCVSTSLHGNIIRGDYMPTS